MDKPRMRLGPVCDSVSLSPGSGPQAQDHSENLLWMGLDWPRRTQVYCYLVHQDGQAWPQGEPGKTPVPQLLCHWLLLAPTL